MKTLKSLVFSTCLLGLFLLSACENQNSTTTEPNESLAVAVDAKSPEYIAVEATILDYVEGIYEVDSTRIERSVHPELRKRGYWYSEKDSKYLDDLDMTYEQLVSLAAGWNKSGERANAESPKEIDIYDINDRTASAKLTAEWGIDYFHLANMDGKWKIVNVLWQSAPIEEGATTEASE